jgi:protein-L-isoaspartate(D-aspartate) O-methyltransferase
MNETPELTRFGTTPFDPQQARRNMIEQQVRPWDVHDPAVLELLELVPRHRFVAPHLAALAYVDFEMPLLVGGRATGQTMFPPRVEARLLQEVALRPHERVLEIGAGSGYMAALAAHRAQTVWTIEIDPELAKLAARKLAAAGIHNAHVLTADGLAGLPEHAPFDVILVSGAMSTIAPALLDQLAPGGRLAAIVGRAPAMQAQICIRKGDGVQCRTLFETLAAPLRGAEASRGFRF